MTSKAHAANALVAYMCDHSLRLSAVQQSLIDATVQLGGPSVMLGSADALQLLANLCRAIGAKRTLDVGMFTGYSALTIAAVLPQDGELITMDVSDRHLALAQQHWQRAEVQQKIQFRQGPALETLRRLVDAEAGGRSFDFAFIDADKENYRAYYELCLQLVRPGGLIAIDNVLWSGRVLDASDRSELTVAIRDFNEFVRNDQRVHLSMINCGDGVTLAFVI